MGASEIYEQITRDEWFRIGAACAIGVVLSLPLRSFWILSLLKLPGTLAHELCHLVPGLLLGARPVGFTIIPKRGGDGAYTLGSVSFENIRWYSGWLIGLAPLALLPISFSVLRWRAAIPDSGAPEFFWLYVCATFAISSWPSRADFRIVAAYSWFFVLAVGWVWWKFLWK